MLPKLLFLAFDFFFPLACTVPVRIYYSWIEFDFADVIECLRGLGREWGTLFGNLGEGEGVGQFDESAASLRMITRTMFHTKTGQNCILVNHGSIIIGYSKVHCLPFSSLFNLIFFPLTFL